MDNVEKAFEILTWREKGNQYEILAESATTAASRFYCWDKANTYIHKAYDGLRLHFPGESIKSLREALAAYNNGGE